MSFASATYEVARKEVLQLLRTKRLMGVGIALILSLLLLTIFVPSWFLTAEELQDLTGTTGLPPANFILLFFLSGLFLLSGFFFIQLLPILLTADAVCSEWQNRTIFLLLSKPVPRQAFVLGKFLGIAGSIAVFVSVLLALDYVVMLGLFGSGSAAGFGRFLGALGIIVLGVMAFSAVALFYSTLTRSSVVSMLLAVVSWIILFPLMARLDFFVALFRFGSRSFAMSNEEAGIGWSQYLSPGELMKSSSSVLVPGGGGDLFGFLGGGQDVNGVAISLALVAHIVVFVGLALLVVQRRDFE